MAATTDVSVIDRSSTPASCTMLTLCDVSVDWFAPVMRSFRGLNKKLKGVSSNMLTNGASVLKGASQLKGLVAGKPRVDVRDLRCDDTDE